VYKTTSRQFRIDQARSELLTNLENGSNALSKGNINVLATVIGGTAFELEQHIKYVAEQTMLLTAEDQYLEDVHGKLWNVPKNGSTKFDADIEFAGVNGAVIPANTELQSATGNLYLTTAEAVIESSKALVSIKSLEPGSANNLELNSELSLTEAIDNLETTAILKNIKVPGQDQEAEDAYRLRIQQHINNRNNTGTLADYELWAKQVTGIEKAYAKRNINGAGTVGIYIVTKDSELKTKVEENINNKKPVGAEIYVLEPADQAIEIAVNITPNNSDNDTRLRAAISNYFNKLDFEESIIASQLNKVISDIPEILDFSTNLVNTKVKPGHIAKLGNITVQEFTE